MVRPAKNNPGYHRIRSAFETGGRFTAGAGSLVHGEFRTLFNKKQYRLFAFWDKSDNKVTIVIATHGIIKKTQKTPKKEINKATEIMNKYFNEKK